MSLTFDVVDGRAYSFGAEITASVYAVTPVPLPAGVWLLGSAVLGLAGIARRKRA